MKIFLDTADVDEIRKAHETGLINGVTTNPTLIKRSGRDPVEVIKEIYFFFLLVFNQSLLRLLPILLKKWLTKHRHLMVCGM